MTSLATADVSFQQWLASTTQVSQKRMLDNIHPAGTVAGVVVASPSKSDPDYFFHWVRDSALTMDVVFRLYEATKDDGERARLENLLTNYVWFSKRNQETTTLSGPVGDETFRNFGEPKFHVDGRPFDGPWGRPQLDGPALRAIVLVKFLRHAIKHHLKDDVIKALYRTELPARSVIKRDLECVYYQAFQPNFDLWEETMGDHFYTHMVQRRALLDGADLADEMGDPGAAAEYRRIAGKLGERLQKYWREDKHILRATIDRVAGADYKTSELDSAVVLAILHATRGDGFFHPNNSQVLSTVNKLEQAFQAIYPINHRGLPGLAVGRYPEDKYDGVGVDTRGNPWFLITAGYAEFYYRLVKEFRERKLIIVDRYNYDFFKALNIDGVGYGATLTAGMDLFDRALEKLHAKGDAYLERVKMHSPDGRFSEQFNRDSGYRQGAVDLTWSYAAFLTASWERD